ncbi:hypothetical protein PS838_01459 [Pseudomonas fluorescens]|nr:hypothetical protein PS838_01459 [Pseudomonas fluorescens]
MEIFLIPGQLAVAQFHCQPSTDSAVTVPIGYITVEGERLARNESVLKNTLVRSSGSETEVAIQGSHLGSAV